MTPALTEKVNRFMGRAEYGNLDVLDTLANAYMDGTTLQYDPDLTCEFGTKAANAGPCGIECTTSEFFTTGTRLFYNPELVGFWLNEACIRSDRDVKKSSTRVIISARFRRSGNAGKLKY